MTQPAKGQEPSMEEILASIRRIIADDDATKTPAKAAEPMIPQPAPAPPPRPATLPPRLSMPPPPLRPAAPPRVVPSAPPPDDSAAKQAEIDAMLAQLQAVSNQGRAPIEEPASDILDLTEHQMATPEPAPGFQTIDGGSDVVFEESPPPEPEPEPAPPPRPAEDARRQYSPPPPPAPRDERDDRSLISAATTAAVDSAFNTLAQTVLVQNGRTLEDLVREMLRPMLKTWLDDNLPGMVERLVRAEIERVSRGRG
jgi:cell pole-organizing protein PopZ